MDQRRTDGRRLARDHSPGFITPTLSSSIADRDIFRLFISARPPILRIMNTNGHSVTPARLPAAVLLRGLLLLIRL